MDNNYKDVLIENTIIRESIPWRSGKIPLSIGRTSINGLNQDCFILNNLKFVFKLTPSFLFVVPKMELLHKVGNGTNGWIIVARKAQELEYETTESGDCYGYTYFYGRGKPGRTFDLYFRMFERGFSLEEFEGFSMFNNNAVLDISCKKEDYSKSTLILGRQEREIDPEAEEKAKEKIKIPARIRRVR